jgi:hypothetical protein
VTGRALIRALARRQEPDPRPAGPDIWPAGPDIWNPAPRKITPQQAAEARQRFTEAIRRGDPPRILPDPPVRILGYAVARYDGRGHVVLTHTSPMPLDEAQREAGAQRAADRVGYSWAVVEIRRVM